MALGSQGPVCPSPSTLCKGSASMVSRLLRKRPPPGSAGLWVAFVWGGLLLLLGWGLALRMLLLPR